MASNPNNPSRDDTEPKLPPALVDGLRAAFGGGIEVPDEVDGRIRAAARQELVRRRRRVVVRWIEGVSAAAAAIVLAVWLTFPASVKQVNSPGSQSPALTKAGESPGKTPLLDPSRKPDILDAFALAKRLERNAKLDASWDVNRDGRIDYQDVDTVAARAVRLEERAVQ